MWSNDIEIKLQERLYASTPSILVYLYGRISQTNQLHAVQKIISKDGSYQHCNKNLTNGDNKCHRFYLDIIACYNLVRITTSVIIYETSDKCISKVLFATASLEQGNRSQMLNNPESEVFSRIFAEKEYLLPYDKINSSSNHIQDAIIHLLQDIATNTVVAWQALQRSLTLKHTCQRIVFELEILTQADIFLDVIMNENSDHLANDNKNVITFLLPLLQSKCNPNSSNMDNPNCSPLQNSIIPVFMDPRDTIILFIYMTYTPNSSDICEINQELHWPEAMQLSSEITQVPHTSQFTSALDSLNYCSQHFYLHWKYRQELVEALKNAVIVLEYDAIDYSYLYFMVHYEQSEDGQLQLIKEMSDLLISAYHLIILSLQFKPEYFATKCLSDIELRILNGDTGELVLLPSIAIENHTSDQFIELFLNRCRLALSEFFLSCT